MVYDNDVLDQIRNLFAEIRIFRANRDIYGGCVQRVSNGYEPGYNTKVIVIVCCHDLRDGLKMMKHYTSVDEDTYQMYRKILTARVTDRFIPYLQSMISKYFKRGNIDAILDYIAAMECNFANGDEAMFNAFMNHVLPLNMGPDHCFDTKYIVNKTFEFFKINKGKVINGVSWNDTEYMDPLRNIKLSTDKPELDNKPKETTSTEKPKRKRIKKTGPKIIAEHRTPINVDGWYKSDRFNHYTSDVWQYLFKPNKLSFHPYIEIVERDNDDAIYTDIDVTVYILQAPTEYKPAMDAYRQFIYPNFHRLICDISQDIMESSGFKKLKIPFNFYKVSDIIIVSDYRLIIKFSLRV